VLGSTPEAVNMQRILSVLSASLVSTLLLTGCPEKGEEKAPAATPEEPAAPGADGPKTDTKEADEGATKPEKKGGKKDKDDDDEEGGW
jgi:hypothetical protein